MSWLTKIFGKNNSDKIDVSQDAKECSNRKARKKSNRSRSNSLVMRQKMQKKIAESAKERVLDRRRTQQLEDIFELNDVDKQTDMTIDTIDFRANNQPNKRLNNRVIKHLSLNRPNTPNQLNRRRSASSERLNEQANNLIRNDQLSKISSNNLNRHEKKINATEKLTSSVVEKLEDNGQNSHTEKSSPTSVNGEKESKTSFTGISKKEHQLNCSEQPELSSYRSLHSPSNLIPTVDQLETKHCKPKKNSDKSTMSLDQMQTRNHHTTKSMSPQEDSCAINELLEGRMDLQVIVPAYLIKNQKVNTHTVLVLINVERSTPMLDLLIQIGNKIKFTVNDYKIVVIDELRNNYKANTPIGSLDVNQIQIVPKTSAAIALDREKLRQLNAANQSNQYKSISTFNKLVQNSSLNSPQQPNTLTNGSLNGSGTIPFQTTFRLQVNLPHNQRMVFRVTPATRIREVKDLVCEEKELNKNKYQLVVFADLKQQQHPQILELERTLAFYAVNEVALISNKDLHQMQMQNQISSLNAMSKLDEGTELDAKLNGSLNNSLNSIVNSQSTAASVPRKAIISLLSATNQLEADCDYSNNICTKNKCVCNRKSDGAYIQKDCQKRVAKSESSACSNRMIRRKKAPAPQPPIIDKENHQIKRSISNSSVITSDQKINSESKAKSQLIASSKNRTRHNSGSDSSGYHECLSTANSPNGHQFGGSMINLSNSSLTVSPMLEHQRMTSTPSTKQYRSTQHLGSHNKKRKAPQAPFKQLPRIEQFPIDSLIDNQPKIIEKSVPKVIDLKLNRKQGKNDQSGNNILHLELKNETLTNNDYTSKKNLKSNSSFKSDASSGHSSGHSTGHSSSNSPQPHEDREIDSSSSNCCDNSLEDEVQRDQLGGDKSSSTQHSSKDSKLSKLMKESLNNRFQNSKSPTSVASEPIYLTPKTYFNNQCQSSESTSSIVMLNMDDVRPSSAPNYCEEKIETNPVVDHQQVNNQIQNENSKDSGIFLKENGQNARTVDEPCSVQLTDTKDFKIQNGQPENRLTIDHVQLNEDVNDSANNNVTTLIINVNDDLDRERINEINKREDIQSISTLIENGDLIVEDRTPTKNRLTTQFFKQLPGSTGNIAPASYAMNGDELKAIDQPIQNEASFQTSNSRISNIRYQFETTSVNKPKIRLPNKLANFRIGSYSNNHTDDIYSESKSSYSVENARLEQTNKNANKSYQPHFRYLSSPVQTISDSKLTEVENSMTSINLKVSQSIKKPSVPINLNAIKFNEVALNEGLSVSVTKLNKLNNLNSAEDRKEIDNYNSDEFNDNPELNSLYTNDLVEKYSNFDYKQDRTLQSLLNNNLSMITPQPYKNNRASVPRKLFFNKDTIDLKVVTEDQKNDSSSSTNIEKTPTSERILTPPPLPQNSNTVNNLETNGSKKNDTNDSKHLQLQSSNSFKENFTRSYLVSDQKKNTLVNSSSSKMANLSSDFHDCLMSEIRAFGGRDSLKRVPKQFKEFEIEF